MQENKELTELKVVAFGEPNIDVVVFVVCLYIRLY